MKSSTLSKLTVILVLLIATSAGNAATLPKTADLVPAETVLLVDIPDFGSLTKQFEQTSFHKLWKDPAMSAFAEKFETGIRDSLAGEDSEVLRIVMGKEKVLPTGRVAVALVLNDKTAADEFTEPPLLIIAQWGDNINAIKDAVAKDTDKAVADGSAVKSEDFRDVKIMTEIKEQDEVEIPDWENYDPNVGKPVMKKFKPAPISTSYCFVDDCLVAGADIDLVKFTVAHIQGATGEALGADYDYTATLGAVGTYHDIDVYVNFKHIQKQFAAEDTTGQMQTYLTNLGLDNVTGFGFSIGLARQTGVGVISKAFLKVNGAKRGICKMFDIEAANLTAPRFLPDSAYAVTMTNLNMKKFYEELYQILSTMGPGMAAGLNMPIIPPTPDGQPGLTLKSGIIDNLGSGLVLAQSIKKPFEQTKSPSEMVFAIAVDNRAELEKSIDKIHGMYVASQDPDSRRELLGHTMYLMSIPGLPFFGGGMAPMQAPTPPAMPTPAKMAITVTDSHVIIGEVSSVESVIRSIAGSGSTPVSSAEWYKRTSAAIPSVAGMIGLEDTSAGMEMLWWMFKQVGDAGGMNSMSPIGMMMDNPEMANIADFKLLPGYDAVKKYFGVSAAYGISRADGFYFESKYLDNPGQ